MKAIKAALKKSTTTTKAVRTIRHSFGYTPEKLSLNKSKKLTPALIQNYLASNTERKLQIGCQSHPFPGWLNVDIEPKSLDIALMDATKPFPLPDSSFDFIFTEHMIEHISLEDGLKMLDECFRILKPGGKIRVGTPDLQFICSLISDKNHTHQDYIEFSKRYFKDPFLINDAVVVNNFFRDWGHKFIYDHVTLKSLLEKQGFVQVQRKRVYESDFIELSNLEKHGHEITEKFNALESLILEAQKK